MLVPNVPDLSMTMEAFQDTPMVNGTVYPYMDVQPQAYRFRILNAANDRMWNLQLYAASTIVDEHHDHQRRQRLHDVLRWSPSRPPRAIPRAWAPRPRPPSIPRRAP